MEIIRKGSERAAAIVENRHPDTSASYRLSAFVLPFSENGVHLLMSTLTGQVLLLDGREHAQLGTMQKQGSVPWSFLAENGLEELARQRFAVEKDWDDTELYLETLRTMKMMHRDKPGLSSYTVIPTSACNARCVYCFEEGTPVMTMSPETAERVADYICETKQEGRIHLAWFGGEPLLGHQIISGICRTLNSRGIEFQSSTISNGSLITPDLADEMREVWHLKKAQISLDGDRETYRIRKRYADPERYNYDAVMRGIRLLADRGVKTILRVNCDRGNLAGMKDFLEEMEQEFGEFKKVSVYLRILYQAQTAPDVVELLKEIDRYSAQIVLNAPEPFEKEGKDSLKLNSCTADCMDKCVIIDPKGDFYACDECPPGTSWGNIFDGITDPELFERMKAPRAVCEPCRQCLMLPRCTPFAKSGCRVVASEPHCLERRKLDLERQLSRFIRNLEG